MSSCSRLLGAFAFPLSIWAADADAQVRRQSPVPPAPQPEAARANPFELRMVRDELGAPADILTQNIAIGPNMNLAIGRFAVPSFRAPRMEGAEIRRGYRNIAAVGFNFRF